MQLTPEMLAACVTWEQGPSEEDLLPACRWAMSVTSDQADTALEMAICQWPTHIGRDAFREALGDDAMRNPLDVVLRVVDLSVALLDRQRSSWRDALSHWVDLAIKYTT